MIIIVIIIINIIIIIIIIVVIIIITTSGTTRQRSSLEGTKAVPRNGGCDTSQLQQVHHVTQHAKWLQQLSW